MKGLLYGKLKMLIRKPWPFLLTTIVCLMFAFFTSQSGANEVTVPYSTEGGRRSQSDHGGIEGIRFNHLPGNVEG
ncbi:hypothetical protein ACPJHQ_01425 [Rossellomorea sp. H39__3]